MWSSWTSAITRDFTEFAQVLSHDAVAAIGSVATSALQLDNAPLGGDEDFMDPALLKAVTDPEDIVALQADLTTYSVPLAEAEQAIFVRWTHYSRCMEVDRWKELLTHSEEIQNAYGELVYEPSPEEPAQNEDGQGNKKEQEGSGQVLMRLQHERRASRAAESTVTDEEFFGRYFWRLYKLRQERGNALRQRGTSSSTPAATAPSGAKAAGSPPSASSVPPPSISSNNKRDEDAPLDGWDEVDALLHTDTSPTAAAEGSAQRVEATSSAAAVESCLDWRQPYDKGQLDKLPKERLVAMLLDLQHETLSLLLQKGEPKSSEGPSSSVVNTPPTPTPVQPRSSTTEDKSAMSENKIPERVEQTVEAKGTAKHSALSDDDDDWTNLS